jgi:hypothetical protein
MEQGPRWALPRVRHHWSRPSRASSGIVQQHIEDFVALRWLRWKRSVHGRSEWAKPSQRATSQPVFWHRGHIWPINAPRIGLQRQMPHLGCNGNQRQATNPCLYQPGWWTPSDGFVESRLGRLESAHGAPTRGDRARHCREDAGPEGAKSPPARSWS